MEMVVAVPTFWMRTACCGFAGFIWFTTSRRPRASAPRLEHSTAPAPVDPLLSRCSAPPVTVDWDTFPDGASRSAAALGGGTISTVSSKVVGAARAASGNAITPIAPAASPVPSSIERRVSAGRDASLRCACSTPFRSAMAAASSLETTPRVEIESEHGGDAVVRWVSSFPTLVGSVSLSFRARPPQRVRKESHVKHRGQGS